MESIRGEHGKTVGSDKRTKLEDCPEEGQTGGVVIGLPREIKEQEHRTAMVPATISKLCREGHLVLVEKGAGMGAGYPDGDYEAAGARLVDGHEEAFDAEMVVKVKEPQLSEFGLFRPGQVLFTYLHLAADRALTEALLASGVTAVGYETVRVKGKLPLLEPMSEIAGRMSVLVGAYHLARHRGGKGVLLGGVPGVLPGKVVVMGGGAAGTNAARVATGLGADVTILEVDHERMRFLDITMHAAHTLYSSEGELMELLPGVDLLVGAVLVPGARAPRLVTRAMLRRMKPGSVFVDLAVDQGGCSETTRPTTHDRPTYEEEGVVHYCVANMPGAYPRTATQALTHATAVYVESIARLGLQEACGKLEGLKAGINVLGGRLCCPAVAEAHGMPFEEPFLRG